MHKEKTGIQLYITQVFKGFDIKLHFCGNPPPPNGNF